MINVYNEFRDSNGFIISGRTKLFIREVDSEGSILEPLSGVAFTTEENGTQFIVDEWLIPQLDKVRFVDGVLSVKDGESLEEPIKSDLELEEEDLLRRIAEIQAQKKANTEEQADEPTE